MRKHPGAASWPRTDHSEPVPSAAPEDTQLVRHKDEACRGLSSLTLVRMLERWYFSLEHSSIASPRRAELGFWELFKASISAETVWIWSAWKIKTNMDLKVKETEKDSKTSKQGSFGRGGGGGYLNTALFTGNALLNTFSFEMFVLLHLYNQIQNPVFNLFITIKVSLSGMTRTWPHPWGLEIRMKMKVCPSDETNKQNYTRRPRQEIHFLKTCTLNAVAC